MSISTKGWPREPIDAVVTLEGLVTIDNTRVAIAQQLNMQNNTC